MIYGPALQESATSPKTLNTSSAGIYQLFSGALQVMPDDGLPQFVDVRGKWSLVILIPLVKLMDSSQMSQLRMSWRYRLQARTA